jgi:hypothetical protein
MDTFRWISVVVSMILGLGVARLLLGAVAIFKARHGRTVDWLPLAWGAAIFLQQVTLWWSLEDAGTVATWTLPAFLLLVGLVLALFLAAAVIFPVDPLAPDDTFRTYFERDGRWSLLGLAAFNALAMVANWELWNEGLFAESVRLNLVLTIVPIAGFLGSRRVQAGAALAYVVLLGWSISRLSPIAY